MEPEKKSNGALVGLIVIIIILIVGGVYVWKSNQAAVEKMKSEQSKALNNEDAAALDALEIDSSNTNPSPDVNVNEVN